MVLSRPWMVHTRAELDGSRAQEGEGGGRAMPAACKRKDGLQEQGADDDGYTCVGA